MADTDDSSERKLAARRAWYAANREKSIARAAQWAKDNKERNSITRRARYAANREKALAEVHKWREDNPELLAYTTHKHGAKARGVPFLLTFDEWCAIWRESGKFAQRGHRGDQYVMARFGDVGPYAVGNVRIITARENALEGWTPQRHRAAKDRKLSEEARKKLADVWKGRRHSDETRQKMRIAAFKREAKKRDK